MPRGYVHARVSFDNAGAATEVVVDAPAELSASAVACIGHAAGQTAVPPFDGDSVSIGASWFVP